MCWGGLHERLLDTEIDDGGYSTMMSTKEVNCFECDVSIYDRFTNGGGITAALGRMFGIYLFFKTTKQRFLISATPYFSDTHTKSITNIILRYI